MLVGCSLPQLIAITLDKTGLTEKLRESQWYLPMQTSVWTFYALCIFSFVRVSANDFIYFQF